MNASTDKVILLRLIYLWAFVEGGLGGILHLLHIPLTGYLIGGFSIFITTLIAKYSQTNIRWMLYSLGMVILTKFSMSPFSPITAYIALSFQGLLGIVIFRLCSIHSISIHIYAILVMIENAIQKPIVAYLFFHKEILDSFRWINQFGFANRSVFMLFLGLYLFSFILWALVLSRWICEFLKTPPDISIEDLKKIKSDISSYPSTIHQKNRRRIFLFILAFGFGMVYFFQDTFPFQSILYKLLLFILLFGFVLPFILQKILLYFQTQNKNALAKIMDQTSLVKDKFLLSYELSKTKRGMAKIKKMLFYSISLQLMTDDETTN